MNYQKCFKSVRMALAGMALMTLGQNCSEQAINFPQTQGVSSDASLEIAVISGADLAFGEPLQVEVSNGDPAAVYEWYRNGQKIDDVGGMSYEVSASSQEEQGSYQVMLDGRASNTVEVSVGYPKSCKNIVDILTGKTLLSGSFEIDPDGNTGPLQVMTVNCDMTTDGGGWTEITLDMAHTVFSGTLTDVLNNATASGIDADHRPFCRDSGGRHLCYYDFQVPFGYSAFYLKDYTAKALPTGGDTSEIEGDYAITDWTNTANSGNGDIALGSPSEPGPKASFSDLGTNFEGGANAQPFAFPQNQMIFALGAPASALRIGFAEAGSESEGWQAWYSGSIWVR